MAGEEGIEVAVTYAARVVYGERFNEPKMGAFLLDRCGDALGEDGMGWGDAVGELGEKLLARGKK